MHKRHYAAALAVLLSLGMVVPAPCGAKPKAAKGSKARVDKKGKKGKDKGDENLDPTMKKAIDHFQKGVTFFNEENYGAALAEFLESFEIAPNFELRYNIGVCYLESGKPVEALEEFEKYIEEGGKNIPASVKKDVQKMMGEISAKIGTLVVECSEKDAQIVVDEVRKYNLPLDEPLRLKAGMHVVVVKKAGFEKYARELSVASGEQKVLKVTLEPVKQAEPVTIVKYETVGKGGEKDRKPKKPLRWLWFTLGTAGAIGAAAGVTGGLALKKQQDMEDAVDGCTNTLTRDACPEAYSARDDGKKLMLAANILAGAAGAAAVAGMILFILDKPKVQGEKKPEKAEVEEKKISSRLMIAPSGAGLQALVVW
jgi:hypothetical protein